MKKISLFTALTTLPAAVVAQDTLRVARGMNSSQDGPGLFAILLVLMIAFISALIVSAVLITVVCGLLIALVAGSIISFSALVGFYDKSIRSGARALIIVSFMFFGGLAGFAGDTMFVILRHSRFSPNSFTLVSIIAGMVTGLGCSWLMLFAIRRTYTFVKAKFFPAA